MKRHYLNFIDDYKKFFDKNIEIYEKGYRDLMEKMLPDSRGVYNISKTKFRALLKSKFNLTDYETYSLMCDQNTKFLSEIYFIYDLNFKPTKQEIHQEDCPDYFLLNFTDETKSPVWEKYDFYIIAMQYSPNVCILQGTKCLDILKTKENYKIGIHGLWPSYTNGNIPQQCNLGEDIQINVSSNKEYFDNYVLKNWYSLYKTDDYFLTHEYNTHGFCYNKFINESVDNFYIYLNKTLEIFNHYNFSIMFDNITRNLKPGEYLINKSVLIKNLEERYLHNSFVFTCFTFNNRLYLNEIYFKLNKNFGLMDGANLIDSCNGEEIWLNVI